MQLPQSPSVNDCVKKVVESFWIGNDVLREIMTQISHAFDKGLHADPDVYFYSPIKMLPTHLNVLPNRSDEGVFFSIDLGGSNLRFFRMHNDGKELHIQSFKHTVPLEVINNVSGEPLFDFIAEKIFEGLESMNLQDIEIPFLGFTFSFPCSQQSLCSGRLIRWTKGYKIDSVKGQDIVELLRNSCRKKGLKIRDFPLINDTTGTLLCGAYEDSDAVIGIINGTGTNACYIEDMSRVMKFSGPSRHNKVLINTEWGAYGEHQEMAEFLTPYDVEVDRKSVHPGEQIFEKMISGLYLGEIVRLILVELTSKKLIFNGSLPQALSEQNGLETAMLSLSYEIDKMVEAFDKSYNIKLNTEEAEIIAYVCDVISIRTSRLTAAGLAALLERIDRSRCVIAADGSMFTKHPRFIQYTTDAIKQLLPDKNFEIILVEDGSGKGAALAACVASSGRQAGISINE